MKPELQREHCRAYLADDLVHIVSDELCLQPGLVVDMLVHLPDCLRERLLRVLVEVRNTTIRGSQLHTTRDATRW